MTLSHDDSTINIVHASYYYYYYYYYYYLLNSKVVSPHEAGKAICYIDNIMQYKYLFFFVNLFLYL